MLKGLSVYRSSIPVYIALLGINSSFAGSMGENRGIQNNLTNKLEIYGSGGPAFSKLGNDKSVAINSFVVNNYNTNEQTNWQGLWGVGLGHSFGNIFNAPLNFSLGVAGYMINLGNVRGTEYPFVNDDVYDTLNYQFTAKSSAVLAEARVFYTSYFWQPFALVGIGGSWNRLSNYSEAPTDPSLSAAPVTTEFGNHTNNEFAYELGVGIQRQIHEDLAHKIRYVGSLDYRYVNFGKGQLASFPAQTTGDTLQIGSISTQGIMFSLKISFG